jgi:hypothetical protein
MNRTALVLTILSIMLAGCSPAAKPGPAAPTIAGAPPATPTPADALASSPVDIAGVWKGAWQAGGPGYLAFKEDGTFGYSPNPDGSQGYTGTYSFDGTKLVLRMDQELPDCGPQSGGYYEVQLKKTSGTTTSIRFTLVNDICQPRVKLLTVDTPEWTKP